MKWSGMLLGTCKEGQHSLEEEDPFKESTVGAHNEGTVVHSKQGSKHLTESP
jgi:hypothetical protein